MLGRERREIENLRCLLRSKDREIVELCSSSQRKTNYAIANRQRKVNVTAGRLQQRAMETITETCQRVIPTLLGLQFSRVIVSTHCNHYNLNKEQLITMTTK